MPTTSLHIEHYAVLDSTNALVRARAVDGEGAGLVVIADRQTAGRGRLGRAFFSPPGCGLYLSVLLRPTLAAADALLLTTATAVAVAEAIEAVTGLAVGIKWVNDLYLDGRKVCGILAESAITASGRLDYAVIGIGVNVRAPVGGFPDELRDIAGSLLPADAPDLRPALTDAILARLLPAVDALPARTHLAAYRARSTLLGRRVTVLPGGEAVEVEGIDDDAHLIVRCADGTLRALSSGEISVRPEEKGGVR